jgi:hypothetical protein
MRLHALLPLCSIVCFWSVGCDEEFDPQTLIVELRILGIAAEPADLAPGESTTLRVLAVGNGEEPIEYAWEWCPFTDGPNAGYTCPDPAEYGIPEELAGVFDLGDQSTALLLFPGDPETLRQTCESLLDVADRLPDFVELPDCENGLEITVRLTVRAGDVEKIAIKRVFFWFETPDESERNHNPSIATLAVDQEVVAPDDLVTVRLGGTVAIEIDVVADSVETFVPRSDDEAAPRDEEILFSWFSSAGEWERTHSFSDEGNVTLREAGENVLTMPDDGVTDVKLFVVIRDGRGGADWVEQLLTAPEEE